jgi:hypothetical protein
MVKVATMTKMITARVNAPRRDPSSESSKAGGKK